MTRDLLTPRAPCCVAEKDHRSRPIPSMPSARVFDRLSRSIDGTIAKREGV